MVIIMYFTIPYKHTQCCVYESQRKAKSHPKRFIPPFIDPISYPETSLNWKFDGI
jgi:hypothetical protein